MKWPVSVSVHAKDFSEARMAEFETAGIRYMELTSSSVEEIGAVLDRLSDFKKAAEKHRVKIRSVYLPFFPFEEIDPADRDVSKRGNFIRTQMKILQAAAAAGIGFIPAPNLIRMQRGRSGSAMPSKVFGRCKKRRQHAGCDWPSRTFPEPVWDGTSKRWCGS